MDRLILCEGRNDTFLVEEFLGEENPRLSIDKFRAEELDFGSIDSLQGLESERIRRFREAYNEDDVLVKSENGLPNLEQIFPRILRQLRPRSLKIRLLIDLDGGELSEFVESIDERISGRHPNHSFERGDEIYRNSHMIAVKTVLLHRGSVEDTHNLVAFRDNFEDSAGIDKESDDDDTIREKSRQFLTENKSVRHTLSESL